MRVRVVRADGGQLSVWRPLVGLVGLVLAIIPLFAGSGGARRRRAGRCPTTFAGTVVRDEFLIVAILLAILVLDSPWSIVVLVVGWILEVGEIAVLCRCSSGSTGERRRRRVGGDGRPRGRGH